MINKKFKLETRYGVVINRLENVIVVGTPKADHFDSIAEMNESVDEKESDISVTR